MAIQASTAGRPGQLPTDTERSSLSGMRLSIRAGLAAGAAMVLVSAIGVVETFDGRMVLDPILSLGYTLLLSLPAIAGFMAVKPPPELEGVAGELRTPKDIRLGTLAGLTAAALLIPLIAITALGDVRDIFISLSPRLVELLTFGLGLGPGMLAILAASAALGGLGSAVHFIPDHWRRPLLHTLGWVLALGLLQDLVTQPLRGLRLNFLVRFVFASTGGFSPGGLLVSAVCILALYRYLEARKFDLRGRIGALPATRQRKLRYAAVVLLLLLFAVLPQVFGSYISEVLDLVGLFLLMGLGLNLVVGFAGLLDLGYVAFFAVGAYATAVLTSPSSPRFSPEFTFWLALPFVLLAAALAGILVGTPVLRMRGDYLAIVTLGFGEIARLLAQSDWLKPVLGGAQGILRIPNIAVGPFELHTPPELFYPIAAFCLLAAYISWRLQDSRIGRAWMAMREDEDVAQAMGINIVSAKLLAFITGAILASFSGAIFAMKIGSVFPHSFKLIFSITVLVLIIVGGLGSLRGVAIGALVIVGLPELLREFDQYRELFYGALLVLMMRLRPEGLLPSARRSRELHEREVEQDAWERLAARTEEAR